MDRMIVFSSILLIGLPSAFGAGGDTLVPGDYKLVIAHYAAAKEPLDTAELIMHGGRAYYFVSGPSLEVIIYNPAAARVELIDLERKVRTELSSKKIDDFVAKLHSAIGAASDKRVAEGGRANQIKAAMSRDLNDPQFKTTFDAPSRRLRLTNPTVEIDAVGALESDPARLELVSGTLTALTKLDAFRDPQGIPPFPKLEALRFLSADHRLRPSELSFLYRLTGPPHRFRWTYRLEPKLSDRELQALARVVAMMGRCPYRQFEEYERDDPR